MDGEGPSGVYFLPCSCRTIQSKALAGDHFGESIGKAQRSFCHDHQSSSEELKAAGHKALFAGVPIDEYEWANFLTDCGFEQFKTEENKGETFMIMVRPFE
ncbi:hypothetical protein [Mesobacillus subterraneus]|uniref:hypothetical protein n=1 Tax=Mesobacillus subterraneus TaxID=285983 RepID=UPI001FE52D31|nr:hypothetical protein [Mesobacillus subterraneus]